MKRRTIALAMGKHTIAWAVLVSALYSIGERELRQSKSALLLIRAGRDTSRAQYAYLRG